MRVPAEFFSAIYRDRYDDLAGMSDVQLFEHYESYGRSEGRNASLIKDRSDFVGLAMDAKTLEIGPFFSPLVVGDNVTYSDFLSTEELVERAVSLGVGVDTIPDIKYVLSKTKLGEIPEKFDAVISSHLIEHQPDLIRHLQDVEKIITDKGRYLVLVPDKRYCFDNPIPETNIAEVIDAWHCQRERHTLRSVIEHRALTSHNDSAQYWLGHDGGAPRVDDVYRAIEEYRKSNGGYIDVHAWQFTPENFRSIIEMLNSLSFIKLSVEELYPTRFNSNEFWAVLSLSS